jgi:hypothetical protein
MADRTEITLNIQQPYDSSSCGAYSLTACLEGLGFFDISVNGQSLTPSGEIPVVYPFPVTKEDIKEVNTQVPRTTEFTGS